MMKAINVIIPCGGSGTRCGLGKNKLLAMCGDSAVIEKTLIKFAYLPYVSRIILPCAEQDKPQISLIVESIICDCSIVLCNGGASRTESVKNALELVEEDCDIITIHDGARPFVTEAIIDDSIECAVKYGSGIAGYISADTIAITDGENLISNVPDRSKCYIIQTPQSFKADDIKRAYAKITLEDAFTDDSSVYAKYITKPHISHGATVNRKITLAEDLNVCDNMFAGIGYDTHRFAPKRDLVLGGINIPYKLGLLGHSDADVLTHAIMDAILNACGERDIGVLFPDTDAKYKNIESIKLLDYVCKLINSKGYRIKNISAVIMCELPKMAPIIPDMRQNLARIMEIEYDGINISATTTEGLGWIGRGEGIASRAICLCYKVI